MSFSRDVPPRELSRGLRPVKISSVEQLEAAGADLLYVTLLGWKLHRVDRLCSMWRAYVEPETLQHSGDYDMRLWTTTGAEALVRQGANTFCRRCCTPEISRLARETPTRGAVEVSA
ncbi:hypothetical protein ACFORH_43500 [Amycolatopsis roodepoortensis]|uniref:Uncharacterized protein n=1 Tax=Amycolatopsis roodepoortensis TaxID=700274 RepID=A0ABR9LIA2_9PSEU|nr:hypothetical protein [Amycolatopsis roodepoortensis]MBE1580389.1 hypothetical protein [Amycolatopsis roodepoortensis]